MIKLFNDYLIDYLMIISIYLVIICSRLFGLFDDYLF